MKGLKQNTLEFDIIPTGNPKTLVFADASLYIAEPERPLLEVLLPGYNKYFLVNIEAKVVNTLNSSTLGYNKALFSDGMLDLPDGVWHFTYKICPYDYARVNKSILRTTLLEIKLAELYDKIDYEDLSSDEKKDYEHNFTRIHILLEAGKLTANHSPKKAQANYELADRLINKLFDKLCKNCKNGM